MRLNKIIVTGIAAAAVLAIAGCGSSSTGAASSAGETAPYAAICGRNSPLRGDRRFLDGRRTGRSGIYCFGSNDRADGGY